MDDNCDAAVLVMDELINYDKLETGTLRLEFAVVDIAEMVGRVCGLMQLHAKQRNVTLMLATTRGGAGSMGSVGSLGSVGSDIVGSVESVVGSGDDIDGGGRDSECESGDGDLSDPPERVKGDKRNRNKDGSPYKRPQQLPSDCVVVGDSFRLNQVLRNLVSNALKFTPDMGKVTVRVSWQRAGLPTARPSVPLTEENAHLLVMTRAGSVRIEVADTGAGLTAQHIKEIGREGVQFNANELQAGQGSGLGVFIVKGIVEQHGGTLGVKSPGLGRGSTFTAELPLYRRDYPELSHQLSGIGAVQRDHEVNVNRERRKSIDSLGRSNSSHSIANSIRSSLVTSHGALTARRGSVGGSVESFVGSGSRSSTGSVVVPKICVLEEVMEGLGGVEGVGGLRRLSPPVTPHRLTLRTVGTIVAGTVAISHGQSPRRGSGLASPARVGSPGPPKTSAGFLLVVDDSLMSRKMLVRLLCAKKYTCVQAEDGLQALEVYRELLGRGGRLDAVLMDFEMPQMNGPTATWHLRQLGYSGLVIGVTGNVLPDDVSYFLSQGADYVLPKPLHMPDFEAKMDLMRAQQAAEMVLQFSAPRTPPAGTIIEPPSLVTPYSSDEHLSTRIAPIDLQRVRPLPN
ncbi:hypothetical protein B484DRAFT_277379 [Ochromonadaceae sp. CCMP2298]|nr:hypothetical protein B484DRAFT_277379 [Ochromonadaceae sp. CCMP2298]